ncbi:hypothetical protein Pla108_32070 [Botrimarina colliarenosi]|uniref:Uncharacterized protein n=1 Tax=Botrimarina colliarenosi TaxID=2528001 RepID=A0A5C6AAA2_9BACT|nr:hypothetical protein [Botrimarina colliarenosi]TWT96125.1 hypothetical protein Pla108_32070 [Botrimarina colliarenosi]
MAIPHVVAEYRCPQTAYHKATSGQRGHLRTLDSLLAYDPDLIRSEAVRPVLFDRDRDETAKRFRHGAKSLTRPSKAPTRSEVMIVLAGLISFFSYSLLQPLTANQIRELFDTAEAWRSGRRQKREPGLPKNDATLQKQILRKRNKLGEWLDPDKTLPAVVRGLRAWAA